MDFAKRFARRAFAPAVVGLIVAGCAAAPAELEDISARARQARTPEEHRSVAAEYRALAQQQSIAAARDEARARGDLRSNPPSSQVRGGRGHFPSVGEFEARAVMEARGAEEYRELARRHDIDAVTAQAVQGGPVESQSPK